MKTPRFAVVPAAGLGTRFLPATKSVPKEMLPIVDKPALLYAAEECASAGIPEMIVVSSPFKTALSDFFNSGSEVERRLKADGKTKILADLDRLRNLVRVQIVTQREPLGLGHAVLCAEDAVKSEDFAVLLPDEVMVPLGAGACAIGQLIAARGDRPESAIGVMEVPLEQVRNYGIIRPKKDSEATSKFFEVSEVVEKPEPSKAPSRWSIPGRYLFSRTVFSFLKNQGPGKNGEIQLADALSSMSKSGELCAVPLRVRRYDTGTVFGYLQANIELALDRPELAETLRPYLKTLLSTPEKGG